jgi:hypothetical protein
MQGHKPEASAWENKAIFLADASGLRGRRMLANADLPEISGRSRKTLQTAIAAWLGPRRPAAD